MQFENSFEVALPPDEAWAVLLDVERIAPSLPGAEITEVVDARTYKGKVAVRLGPVGGCCCRYRGGTAADLRRNRVAITCRNRGAVRARRKSGR